MLRTSIASIAISPPPQKSLCTGIFPQAPFCVTECPVMPVGTKARPKRVYDLSRVRIGFFDRFRNIRDLCAKTVYKGGFGFRPDSVPEEQTMISVASRARPRTDARTHFCVAFVNNSRARSAAAADETASPFVPIIIPVHTFSSAIS